MYHHFGLPSDIWGSTDSLAYGPQKPCGNFRDNCVLNRPRRGSCGPSRAPPPQPEGRGSGGCATPDAPVLKSPGRGSKEVVGDPTSSDTKAICKRSQESGPGGTVPLGSKGSGRDCSTWKPLAAESEAHAVTATPKSWPGVAPSGGPASASS